VPGDDIVVVKLDGGTGEVLWSLHYASPGAENESIYALALDSQGNAYVTGRAWVTARQDEFATFKLDAATGDIKWRNDTSHDLAGDGSVCGVSVQGHLLLNDNKVYLAGGNMVSPAIYAADSGQCGNTLPDEWTPDDEWTRDGNWLRAPRGSELFLVDGEVKVNDQLLYAPRGYVPSRYLPSYFLQAKSEAVDIRGTEKLMLRVDSNSPPGKQAKPLWSRNDLGRTFAVALASNAVLVTGQKSSDDGQITSDPYLAALDIDSGATLWRHELPGEPDVWGLAVDRDGSVLATLADGRLLCFGRRP